MHPARTASGLAAFVACRKKFIDPDAAGAASQASNRLHRFIDLRLLPVDFRHDSGNGPTVPSNYQSLPQLGFVEQSGKMNFRLRCLNLTHNSTGRINQSS